MTEASLQTLYPDRFTQAGVTLRADIARIKSDRRCATVALAALALITAAGAMAVYATSGGLSPMDLNFCYGGIVILSALSLTSLGAIAIVRRKAHAAIQNESDTYAEKINKTFTPDSFGDWTSDVVAHMPLPFFEACTEELLKRPALVRHMSEEQVAVIKEEAQAHPKTYRAILERAPSDHKPDDFRHLDHEGQVWFAQAHPDLLTEETYRQVKDKEAFVAQMDEQHVDLVFADLNPPKAICRWPERLGLAARDNSRLFACTSAMTPEQASMFVDSVGAERCIVEFGEMLTEPLRKKLSQDPALLANLFESTPSRTLRAIRACDYSVVRSGLRLPQTLSSTRASVVARLGNTKVGDYWQWVTAATSVFEELAVPEEISALYRALGRTPGEVNHGLEMVGAEVIKHMQTRPKLTAESRVVPTLLDEMSEENRLTFYQVLFERNPEEAKKLAKKCECQRLVSEYPTLYPLFLAHGVIIP